MALGYRVRAFGDSRAVGKSEESPIFQEPAWVGRLTLKPTNLRAALKHGEVLDGKRTLRDMVTDMKPKLQAILDGRGAK